MELLLNLTWLTVSVALGVLLIASRGKSEAMSGRCTYTRSTAWISYLILIALLLPAISMTDDLMAKVAPTDNEQVVRRHEVSVGGQHHAEIHITFLCTVHDAPSVLLRCIGNLEILPALRAFIPPLRQQLQDRAPPLTV